METARVSLTESLIEHLALTILSGSEKAKVRALDKALARGISRAVAAKVAELSK